MAIVLFAGVGLAGALLDLFPEGRTETSAVASPVAGVEIEAGPVDTTTQPAPTQPPIPDATDSSLLLLLDGFEGALLPCTLILLVAGVAAALTARETALPAITGFSLAVLGFSWLRFSDTGVGWHPLVAAAALTIAVAILLAPPIARLDLVAVLGGALAGFAASELWLPCGGSEFSLLLTRLPELGFDGLVSVGFYLLGALSPLLALGAIHHLTADRLLEIIEPPLSVVGGLGLAGLAVAAAVGFHETLVARLFEWSLAHL